MASNMVSGQNPRGARNLLLVLGAVVVLLGIVTVAVVGKDWVSGLLSGGRDAPTLMIVSSGTGKAGVAAAILSENPKAFAQTVVDQMSGKDGSADADKAPANAAPANTKGKDAKASDKSAAQTPAQPDEHAGSKRAFQLSLLLDSMTEELGGRIASDFSDSGRFKIIPQAKFLEAMDDFDQEKQLPKGTNPLQAMDNKGAEASGSQSVSTDTKGHKVVTIDESSLRTHGLVTIAKKAHADYTLVITVGEPKLSVDTLGPGRVLMSVQPEINCEIFETKGNVAYRYNHQMDKPISETVIVADGVPLNGQIAAKYIRLNERVAQQASREVLAWALDKIAPARIVQVNGGMILNRGLNDGVAQGAVYTVERESGEEIHDQSGSGVSLGRQRTPVGSIVVNRADKVISTVAMASGGPFQKGDFVTLSASSAPTSGSASAAASGPEDGPLGARAIAEANAAKQAGVAMRKVNLAVDHVVLTANGRQGESDELSQAVASALARDPRISILPRAEMSNLIGERLTNQRASGTLTMDPEEGMATSGYLVDGKFGAATSRLTHSITVAGVSTPTSTSTSTTVTGTLRVTKLDSRALFSADGSGPTLAAAADAAARNLLLQMFPMNVVEVDPGGVIRLNRGQDGGVAIGAHVSLYHRGHAIVDKSSGALLSEGARTLIGEATVTDVEPNISTAHVVGSVAVAEGDTAQISGKSAAVKTAAAPSAGKPAAKHAAAPAKPPESGIHF